MDRWHVGVNGYWGFASISMQRGPWWLHAIDGLNLWLFDRLPCWRVPLVGRIPVMRDGERYTLAEWSGDQVCDLWWPVFNAVMQWCWKRYTHRSIDVSLKDLILAWGDEAEPFWREAWDQGTESWKELGPPSDSRVKRTADGTLA